MPAAKRSKLEHAALPVIQTSALFDARKKK
jgi:hypothetical protein